MWKTFYGHGLESHLQRLRATLFHSEGERDSDLEGIPFSARDALKFLQGLSEDEFNNAILDFEECEELEECVQPCPPPKILHLPLNSHFLDWCHCMSSRVKSSQNHTAARWLRNHEAGNFSRDFKADCEAFLEMRADWLQRMSNNQC